MKTLLRPLLALILLTGILLLLFALVPGDLTPLALIQNLADTASGDGSFGAVDLSLYERLQTLALPLSVTLILLGGAALFAIRVNQSGAVKGLMIGLLVVFGVSILAVGHLIALRSRSFIYQYLFIPPTDPAAVEEIPPTPTPLPDPPLEPGQWIEFAKGLKNAAGLTHANDGSGRLFVMDKDGLIWIIANGKVLEDPFLDLAGRIIPEVQTYEQGFLGLVFDPNYPENGYFYVNYIDPANNTVISRFHVSTDPNKADPDSETPVLYVVQAGNSHNGGQLAFGPDGYLYIGLGDGVFLNEYKPNAQSLDTLLGKILRLDVTSLPYTIPPNNPFVNRPGMDEIFAYGLRNPWRFSFDRLTGDLYLGDVGQRSFEEINFIPASDPGGDNFGWNYYEGPEPFPDLAGRTIPPADYAPPLYAYPYEGGNCAIIGGFVYRGQALPALQGTYMFGDFCSGLIWGLTQTPAGLPERQTLFLMPGQISSFGEDQDGELYLVNLRGTIYKLVGK